MMNIYHYTNNTHLLFKSKSPGEELRATVLLQLLRTPSNASAAGKLPEVCDYLARPGLKRKEDTVWPLKARKRPILSGFDRFLAHFPFFFKCKRGGNDGKRECRGLSLQCRDT